MSADAAFTPSRAHQTLYFALSGLCLFGALALAAYYSLVRDRAFVDVASILQGGLALAGLFWVVGMMIARRHRRLAAAIRARANTLDHIAAKLTPNV